jgi:hypothetical protein
MKKKIKDLTVQERADICNRHACPECPLYTDCPGHTNSACEQEIELPNTERAEQ